VRVWAFIFGRCLLFTSSSFFVYAEELKINSVIDGHTLVLSDGRTVRLIGVDCPEFKNPAGNKQNAERLGIEFSTLSSYAQKSQNYLSKLVYGKALRTEIDPANQITHHHDKSRRFLAYVYERQSVRKNVDPNRASAWGMVNESLIRSGHCFTNTRFPFRHKERFLQLEQEAKENGRGVWG